MTTQNIQSPSYLMQPVYWFMYPRVILVRPHAGEKVTPSAAADPYLLENGVQPHPKSVSDLPKQHCNAYFSDTLLHFTYNINLPAFDNDGCSVKAPMSVATPSRAP